MSFSSSDVISVISAALGSGVLITVVNYLSQRRKLRAEGQVAEATAASQIGLAGTKEIEAKLNLLHRIIEVLEQHNVRLEADLDQQFSMNTKLHTQVRELIVAGDEQHIINSKLSERNAELLRRCERLEEAIRRVCAEVGLDADKYM